jgi:hypothetical protein
VPETCPLQYDDALSAETEPLIRGKSRQSAVSGICPARAMGIPPTASSPSGEWHRRVLGEILLRTKVGRLTAKHVVGQRILVPLTKGLGRLFDVAPEGIDAALIQVPRAQLPPHLHAFGAQTHIAQWIDLQVYGRESGVSQTKVTEVTPSRCPGM